MPLTDALHHLLTAPAAISFLVFILLYTPCAAAVAVMHRELGIRGGLFLIIAFQTFFAWILSFIVYRLALLASHSITLFFLSLIAFFALISVALKLLNRINRKQNAL